jgi:hypothetical protein
MGGTLGFLGGALGLAFALAGNSHQHFALARCRLLLERAIPTTD